MGREVKRVALDFSWPMNKVWKGFVNPYYKKCPEAGRTCFNGENAAARYLSHLTSMLTVIADDAMKGTVHPYVRSLPYYSEHPDWSIQPEEIRKRMVDLVRVLTGSEPCGSIGFGGSGHAIFFKLLEMAGIKNPPYEDSEQYEKAPKPAYEWTYCLVCKGSGIDPAVQEQYEAWEPVEPPAGNGWQMWETVSEGSPVSPVKESPEALARWLAENKASSFGSMTATYEQWLSMIKEGWAPSAMLVPGKGLVSGVEAVSSK